MYMVLILTDTTTWYSSMFNSRREAIKHALKTLLKVEAGNSVAVVAVG